MNALAETFRNLGPVRLLALAGVTVGFVLFFSFLVSRLTGSEMSLLYSNLDTTDSGRIVAKLESLAVPYELRGDGTQIFVPQDRVLRLRMAMAEDGLPTGGSVGYELFDHADALGTTNFVQNVNLLRALEGELSRTIKALDNVEAARVHLVMPRRQLFTREKEEASASVVLKLRSAGRFTPQQVLAVQNLIASAVPGLQVSRVSVIDDKGNLLAHPPAEGEDAAASANADEMRLSYENRLTRTIEELLERSVGLGKVRAEVTADMDFDRITTNAEIYDPDGQVVRSTQTVEESADSADKQAQDGVTVGNNLPDTKQQQNGSPGTSASKSARTEETVNYEISKTVKNHIRETGTVKRLSVAVLVDGTYTAAADGTKAYTPRTDAEMQQLEKLVRSAIGFNGERGDTVELVNMPFASVDEEVVKEGPEPLFGLHLADYLRIAELLVLAIVAILVLLLVVRPLVSRLIESIPKGSAGDTPMLSDQSGNAGQLSGPAPNVATAPPARDEIEQMIDLNQVEGRVKASSLKKIGEIIQKHPEETVSIIRTWMFQET
ncbi:MAG: flagellar basal-body MS-ring/collar protein FliF [Alphaproteobacteria bacterium]